MISDIWRRKEFCSLEGPSSTKSFTQRRGHFSKEILIGGLGCGGVIQAVLTVTASGTCVEYRLQKISLPHKLQKMISKWVWWLYLCSGGRLYFALLFCRALVHSRRLSPSLYPVIWNACKCFWFSLYTFSTVCIVIRSCRRTEKEIHGSRCQYAKCSVLSPHFSTKRNLASGLWPPHPHKGHSYNNLPWWWNTKSIFSSTIFGNICHCPF